MNWTEAAINILTATGILGGGKMLLSWVGRRVRSGRNVEVQASQIAAADQIKDISIELVEPIRQELREARSESQEARAEAASARREASDLRRLMDETLADWLAWMQRAKAVLEAHDLPVEPLPAPPIPIRRRT